MKNNTRRPGMHESHSIFSIDSGVRSKWKRTKPNELSSEVFPRSLPPLKLISTNRSEIRKDTSSLEQTPLTPERFLVTCLQIGQRVSTGQIQSLLPHLSCLHLTDPRCVIWVSHCPPCLDKLETVSHRSQTLDSGFKKSAWLYVQRKRSKLYSAALNTIAGLNSGILGRN